MRESEEYKGIEQKFSKLTEEEKEQVRRCVELMKNCPGFNMELDTLMSEQGYSCEEVTSLVSKWWVSTHEEACT